ncbi:MAG: cytidine deaminase [Atribacterota bacterium]|nr:cytidine deaminase [Candidatus Atribacteria bacterium]
MISVTVYSEPGVEGWNRQRVERILRSVLRSEKTETLGRISVSFIGKEEIRKIKNEFFHQDIYTDVISFLYGQNEEDDIWGEILISPEIAKEQAGEQGESLEDEMKVLLIHGFLHLLGYDDEKPRDHLKMNERQKYILTQLIEDEKRERLIKLAASVRKNAYSPYSQLAVGAALETVGGVMVAGCNVENASFGLSLCAERVALVKAISSGYRQFVRLAVIANESSECFPCGACRQVLFEFSPNLEIIAARTGNEFQVFSLRDLFSHPFQFVFPHHISETGSSHDL